MKTFQNVPLTWTKPKSGMCNVLPLSYFFRNNTSKHWTWSIQIFFLTLLWTRSSSRSNLILMSCQLHRVTSGQSNSGHKQICISKLFSHIYQPSVKSIYKTNHFTNIKHTYTNSRHNFWNVSPFNITPVERAHTARTCWYRQIDR